MYEKYYFDISIKTMKVTDLSKRIKSLEEKGDSNDFCKYCHDTALRLLEDPRFNYEEMYEGESNNIAWYIAESCYTRLYQQWKGNKSWYVHIFTATKNSPSNYRKAYEYYQDYPEKYKIDQELDYTIKQMSGLKDISKGEFDRIDKSDSKRVLEVHDLVDYVMKKYCMYDDTTVEYKYVEISLMMTILNVGKLKMHPKLDPINSSHVEYLYVQYERYYKQYQDNEVIYVET